MEQVVSEMRLQLHTYVCSSFYSHSSYSFLLTTRFFYDNRPCRPMSVTKNNYDTNLFFGAFLSQNFLKHSIVFFCFVFNFQFHINSFIQSFQKKYKICHHFHIKSRSYSVDIKKSTTHNFQKTERSLSAAVFSPIFENLYIDVPTCNI